MGSVAEASKMEAKEAATVGETVAALIWRAPQMTPKSSKESSF
jgi:hypothetical protein